MQNVLTSWKEIAQYLGRGVRTVQRWETEYGLPVRRARGETHHAVLALPDELDAWLRLHAAGQQFEMEGLRSEVARLRAENAFLKQELCSRREDLSFDDGFLLDHDRLLRGLQLISATKQLREQNSQIMASVTDNVSELNVQLVQLMQFPSIPLDGDGPEPVRRAVPLLPSNFAPRRDGLQNLKQ